MTVKETIEILSKLNPDAEVVDYSPCGPSKIEKIFENSLGEIVLDTGTCCDKILECGSECLKEQKIDEN